MSRPRDALREALCGARRDHATYHHAALPQDVVLLAAPVTVNAARWEKVSAVVAGRLINAFVRDNVQLGQVRVRVRLRVRGRVRVRVRVRVRPTPCGRPMAGAASSPGSTAWMPLSWSRVRVTVRAR